MRIKLSEKNMDLVMDVVRSKGISLVEAINYLLDHPEEIVSTRGVNENKESRQIRTCDK
ncbi:MAG: hypothetical protein GY861_08055 [bacterium]|nr:hypothetical protein [bacterium]